ncbi:mandelate racemase/muconate lactonizing enzyme family protein [Rubrolithibacter danxiaensis]|uniref:mandelate racemase/muconate lactonizing enzyme family protein n=1 Tax=Rubrolithibacter danxiaensis TaxID=3390805 RepID=UPI003BF8EBAE
MKIVKTEIYRFSIAMEPFEIATGTMNFAQNIFIRVYTDEGFYGVGECSAFPMITGEMQNTCITLAKDFALLWKGKDPLEIASRLQELDFYIAYNTTIKSAFDMALFDISAKAEAKPLYQLLNGTKRKIKTDITIGLSSATDMATKALRLKNQGAEILKIKLGKNPKEDIERIKAIRNAIGSEIPLRIDANQGWTYDEAVVVLQSLESQNIEFCEQPMHVHYDDLLPALKILSPIPIMADESCCNHHDARKLIKSNSCDYINIKLAKSGGIAEALKIHETASNAGIACMIGGMLESRIALSAKVHLAYACPNIHFFDLDTCLLGHLEDPATGGVEYNGFLLEIPDAPGIGVDADEAFLKQCDKWII